MFLIQRKTRVLHSQMAKSKDNGVKIIEKLKQNKPYELNDISQELQCLLALGFLDGGSRSVYTEDIAVCLWKWLPKIYGWKLDKYKYPDKQMPKRGLSYLRTYEWAQGGFNEAIERDGWRLTPLGIDAYNLISHLHTKKINTKFSKQVSDSLQRKIGKSELYDSYLKDNDSFNSDKYLLADFLGVRSGMDRQIRYKFFSLLAQTKEQEIDKYVSFLEKIIEQNSELLDLSKYTFESRQNKPKGS